MQLKRWWRCSLCGQQLPADEFQDIRRERHAERHKRPGHNNIVYGTITWSLAGEY